MRIEFTGSIYQLSPVVIKFFADTDWDPSPHIALGYTNFDVICIAAGGGAGSGYDGDDINDDTKHLRCYGGKGGAGGYHRVQGLLGSLPASVPIEVGLAGLDGADGAEDDGQDGGHSFFFYPSCSSSGGKGGKAVLFPTLDSKTNADGGRGGLGAESDPGHGGLGGLVGGISIELEGAEPGTDGENGLILGNVGQGGGGGAGGTGIYGEGGGTGSGSTRVEATRGGYSSYDSSLLYAGPRGGPLYDPDAETEETIPGFAGGSKATVLDKTQTAYGQSGQSGIVIVRLSVE